MPVFAKMLIFDKINRQPSRCRRFFFFYFLFPLSNNPRCGLCLPVIVIIFPSNVLRFAPTGKSYPPLRQEMQDAFRPEQDRGEAFHTFFLNDQKESVQRKSRRHRFIGQFFFYTNGVNLNTLFTPCLLNYMAFSSSHPVLIQKPRRSPLRRGKLLLSVIAVNTLCL